MINLAMSAETVISFISMVVSVMAFGVVYNKAVRNRVDKTELKDLQSYVDKQDDAIGHRVDGLRKAVRRWIGYTSKRR